MSVQPTQTNDTAVQPGATASTQQAQLILATAASYQAEQSNARAKMLAAVLAVWLTIDVKNAYKSWVSSIGQRIFVLVSILQELIAVDSNGYIRKVLGDQRILYDGPSINPLNFAGIGSDGRDLESLLAGALVDFLQAKRQGLSDQQALARGSNFLTLAINTQIADQARAAESVSLVVADGRNMDTGKKVDVGWVRLLTPPSCGRCAILAGKFYRWSDGFERHPNCFPAGTIVSGPKIEAATRRWFQGELVTIRTASGQQLSVTGNHPVLTDHGWIAARLLMEGDNVISGTGLHSALDDVPDDHQMPARVEDVFDALSVVRDLFKVPSTSEDFHGDGSVGEVSVVTADSHLRLEENTSIVQQFPQSSFAGGMVASALHPGPGRSDQSLFVRSRSTDGIMSGSSLRSPLVGGHLASTYETGLRAASDLHAILDQARAQGGATDVIFAAERILALATDILGGDLGDGDFTDTGARFDAPNGPMTMQNSGRYASRGRDLLQRLAGQVTVDRIVDKISREWSGHVYNLTSAEGWMVTDHLITSNCDCRHIPVTVAASEGIVANPYTYFNSLTNDEQNYYFGKSQAQAIRDGADINQVVNAARTAGSMYRADDGKRYTTEGTTRRGLAGRVLRPTPYQIYKDAKGDRDAAIALLRKFKYIL